jgi:signal transduction histidine kinase
VRRRWTIRHLLLGVNLFVLLVPLGAIVFLQVFDAYLLRQTERQLITESVVIGEAWRARLLDAPGRRSVEEPEIRPVDRRESRFSPYHPVINLGYDVLPPAEDPSRSLTQRDDPAAIAGLAVQPLLRRVQIFNLSGARVVDAEGCVVATSGADEGACLDHLEEVREALEGRYSAVVRQRNSDQPKPSLSSIRRRSKLRVFTAMPVYLNDEVVGAVRMSRTSVAPLEMLWAHRGKVALVLGVVLVFTPVLSYFFSHAISKPVRTLTRSAEEMARGKDRREFSAGPLAPREVLILSESLNRMTAQLTEKSEYVLQFASNVSHELKTPITGITGATELLREEWQRMTDEQRRRFLDNIAADAQRMEHLVSRLLYLARIDSASEVSEEIELEPFLDELLSHFDAPVRPDLSEAPRTIVMNRDHLETAVRNLIDNAVRHGKGAPVDVAFGTEGGRLTVSVRDRGPGISEANRSRVFDRFFTTERERGGTGLGLSIVQAIARKRDGEVDFVTGPEGTTFRLVL